MAGAVEKARRERAAEERRHAAVMRRLHRANHVAQAALSSLTSLQVSPFLLSVYETFKTFNLFYWVYEVQYRVIITIAQGIDIMLSGHTVYWYI